MVKEHKLVPGPGIVVTEELDPKEQNTLISGSSLEVSGGNQHDQLKLATVISIGSHTPDTLDKLSSYGKTELANYQICKVGDIVAFQSLSSHKLRIKGKQYLLVEFEHIKAVLR